MAFHHHITIGKCILTLLIAIQKSEISAQLERNIMYFYVK
jgi:hypothetical protein